MPHAKKTRRLREVPDGSRPQSSKSLRNLQRITLPQAKATATKALGSLGRIKAPALQIERDQLFERYLFKIDECQLLKSRLPQLADKPSVIRMIERHIDSLRRHIYELSLQLQTYDQRICAARTTGPLLY